MVHKKYTINYCSGASCYGWEKEYDRIEEFEGFIKEVRNELSARITVFDGSIGKFIFYKRALSLKPETDYLDDIFRDMRTVTRKIK